jgi:hypothetical protein
LSFKVCLSAFTSDRTLITGIQTFEPYFPVFRDFVRTRQEPIEEGKSERECMIPKLMTDRPYSHVGHRRILRSHVRKGTRRIRSPRSPSFNTCKLYPKRFRVISLEINPRVWISIRCWGRDRYRKWSGWILDLQSASSYLSSWRGLITRVQMRSLLIRRVERFYRVWSMVPYVPLLL